MISADDFDAYNRAVAEMSDGLAARAEAEILAWMRANPGASVEECREHAKDVMSGMAQVADEAAATLAAEWYDAQAEAAGARLEPAVTASVYSPETVDKVARYQARKLAKGDAEGFARRCGELVRNDALRSLNETVIANVGRDRDRGARFARVMTGAENCEFCLMLASRGAVYHTRETAGEFRRFHRGCDCKVVPGFSGDPMEALVEGHDPKDAYERYEAIRKGKLKGAAVEEWRSDREPFEVDLERLESKDYARAVRSAFGGTPPDTAVDDARRMLRHRSGTAYEDLYAYDMVTGARIGSIVTSKAEREVRISGKMRRRIEDAVASGGKVAMMHNHPGSSMPSAADFAILRASGASFGVIACHDGTLYRYEIVGDPIAGYTVNDDLLPAIFDVSIRRGKDEADALHAIEGKLGVRIEHLR